MQAAVTCKDLATLVCGTVICNLKDLAVLVWFGLVSYDYCVSIGCKFYNSYVVNKSLNISLHITPLHARECTRYEQEKLRLSLRGNYERKAVHNETISPLTLVHLTNC